LLDGVVDSKDPARPINAPGDEWAPVVNPMRSAYLEHRKQEPEFTNWAKIGDQAQFIDTLDYIFLSKQWRVWNTRLLPTSSQIKGPLPIEDEPSDHLLIAADIQLKVAATKDNTE